MGGLGSFPNRACELVEPQLHRLFAEVSRSCCFGTDCFLPLPTDPKCDSANVNIINVSDCFVFQEETGPSDECS